MNNIELLRYPIGRYQPPETVSEKQLTEWISIIADFPEKLAKLVSNLTDNQLDTAYREEGWTIRQVIHHCYDSHHNSYTRFKWTLTENTPLIKAYNEAAWCELPDSKQAPTELSLTALNALHAKWVYLLHLLTAEDLSKKYIHPENNREFPLKEVIALYAWHCNHHYAHINELILRKGW